MNQDLFSLDREGGATVISLRLPPHMDSKDFDRLNEAILASLGPNLDGAWIVDLSALAHSGSPLLGLMVNIRQRVLEGGGRLALCGLSAALMRVFTTCCLERLFVICHTRAEAILAID